METIELTHASNFAELNSCLAKSKAYIHLLRGDKIIQSVKNRSTTGIKFGGKRFGRNCMIQERDASIWQGL